MKKSFLIAISAVILVVGILAWWFLKPAPFLKESKTKSQVSRTKDTSQKSPDETGSNNLETETEEVPGKPRDDASPEELRKWRLFMHKEELKSNRPIAFVGKVVDQDENPIEGAQVILHIRAYDEKTLEKIDAGRPQDITEDTPSTLTTDFNGIFSITGKGTMLNIDKIEKEGYSVYDWPENWFRYDPSLGDTHHDDPQHPVVFKMWRNKGSVPLVEADKFYRIIPDGRVYTIDLVNINITEGINSPGDLHVQMKQPAEINTPLYEWSFVIEAIGGGLIESKDQHMFEAPEEGYQQRYEFVFNPSNPPWTKNVRKKFYLKSRDGQVYSSMEIDVIANYGDNKEGRFGVKYYTNPAGSRNLEFDRAKKINKDD